MTNIVISGIAGKMGRTITDILKEKPEQYKIIAGIDTVAVEGIETVTKPSALTISPDVIIDFSNPSLLTGLIEHCKTSNTPIVLATTGYSKEQIEEIYKAAESIPVFFTANMSLGINLLAELCKKASQVLGMDYDIEIIEKHHNQKIDAPSGTALLLANEINSVNNDKYVYTYDRSETREKRSKNEIGIHALRGGTIVGEHDVIFAGKDEVITLAHTAYTRAVFANGALRAAEFVKDKPAGLYSMQDLI